MDYFGFVYLWTNIDNGKKYIGSHHGNENDKYIGSGKYFKSAYKKSPKSFVRTILEYNFIDNIDDTFILEQKYLDSIDNIKDNPEYYNLSNRAKVAYAGWSKGLTKHTNESVRIGVEKRTGIIRKDRGTKRGFSGFANKTHSDLSKDAISSSLVEQHASGSRNAGYEKTRLSKIGVTKENSQGRKNQSEWMKNRIVSDETRKKNSAAFVGRIWVTNGQTSKMIYPAELDGMVGWKKEENEKLFRFTCRCIRKRCRQTR